VLEYEHTGLKHSIVSSGHAIVRQLAINKRPVGLSEKVSVFFLRRRISEVTERRVYASRKKISLQLLSEQFVGDVWTGREFHKRGLPVAQVLSS